MPERIRAIANRLREFVGDRRRAPRYRAQLPVRVSLLDEKGQALPASVEGSTHDLSDGGLGLILPSIRVGGRYIAGGGHALAVTLRLPSASLTLRGTPVRYERLEAEGKVSGYLVGVRITEVSEPDRDALADYLRAKSGRGMAHGARGN